MATPISDEITQKIFKTMEEQSDVLKKMGSRLTKLEEAKLKKAARVEVLDDEEVEDWDEREKKKLIMKGTNNLRKSQQKP